MGRRNVLIEGGSCAGKTTVAAELERRGFHVVHGDRVLAYRGDPTTGAEVIYSGESGSPTEVAAWISDHHLWRVDEVRALAADRTAAVTFFCGGSKNRSVFIDLFDEVFVLEIDTATLNRRLDQRQDEWGSKYAERELVLRLHRTREDVPANAVGVDATAPLDDVVEAILRRALRPLQES